MSSRTQSVPVSAARVNVKSEIESLIELAKHYKLAHLAVGGVVIVTTPGTYQPDVVQAAVPVKEAQGGVDELLDEYLSLE